MKKVFLRILLPCTVAGIALYGWLGYTIDQAAQSTANGENEYVIILGAKVKPGGIPSLSLKNRLDVAADYLHKYEHTKVIVSGGQGADEDRTEASVMKDYLIAAGISEERIVMEYKSTSTYENLLYSKSILPESVTAITVISNDFHLKRAIYLADVVGLQADTIAAPTPRSVALKSKVRERLALLKTYVVGY